MPIEVPDSIIVRGPKPVDDKTKKLTLADRNAIPIGERWTGLSVFVDEARQRYMLRQGIENTDWEIDTIKYNDITFLNQPVINQEIDFAFDYGAIALLAGQQYAITGFLNTGIGKRFRLKVTSVNQNYTGSYHILTPGTTVLAGTLINGTVSVTGTTMTGSGSNFLALGLVIGSRIRAGANTYTVTSLAGLTNTNVTVSASGNIASTIAIFLTGSQVSTADFPSGTTILMGGQTRIIQAADQANHSFTLTQNINYASYQNALAKGNMITFPGTVKVVGDFISGRVNYIEFENWSATEIIANIYAP